MQFNQGSRIQLVKVDAAHRDRRNHERGEHPSAVSTQPTVRPVKRRWPDGGRRGLADGEPSSGCVRTVGHGSLAEARGRREWQRLTPADGKSAHSRASRRARAPRSIRPTDPVCPTTGQDHLPARSFRLWQVHAAADVDRTLDAIVRLGAMARQAHGRSLAIC
jgi:hypothetical protein